MTFKELKNKIKEEQKQLATHIRRQKFLRKPKNQRDLSEEDKAMYFVLDGDKIFNIPATLGHYYRHRHIIYCNMFLNTPYDNIEQKVREGNQASAHLLDKFQKKWTEQLDEALRDSA
jgi:hypothetical protein